MLVCEMRGDVVRLHIHYTMGVIIYLRYNFLWTSVLFMHTLYVLRPIMGFMKTIAIIPVFNGETTIIEVVKRSLPQVDCVIVVDDGSTDATNKRVRKFIASGHKGRIKLLANDQNHGKGFSLRKGVLYAIANDFDVVVTLDCDLEHDPREIPSVLKQITHNDMVLVERISYRSMFRKMLNLWSNLWVRMLVSEVSDTQCGFRAFRTDLLRRMDLTSDDFSIELEMILEAYRNKARIGLLQTKTKKIAESKVTFTDYLRINDLFDAWFIRKNKELDISFFKRNLILLAARIGLHLSTLARITLK